MSPNTLIKKIIINIRSRKGRRKYEEVHWASIISAINYQIKRKNLRKIYQNLKISDTKL